MEAACRGCVVVHSHLSYCLAKPSARSFPSARSSSSSACSGALLVCQAGNASQQDTRTSILQRVDLELAAGNETQALSLLGSADLRAFGKAAQVPQRLYSLADLRLNDIETSRFLSPVDATLGEVRRNLQIAAVLGGIVVWQTLQPSQIQALSAFVALLLISGIDLVILLLQKFPIGSFKCHHSICGYSEAIKVLLHCFRLSAMVELRLYCLIPLAELSAKSTKTGWHSYTLSSLDAYRKEGSLSVQAGTTFVDTQFQEEVKSGKLSAGSLNKYTCIALAGVATEYLLFGLAEGGLSDIQQLDRLMRSLNFTQMKADSQVRWAVLNTVTILRRHKNILLKLASAMLSNKSVGECIDLIEGELGNATEI